uniref:Uncharacterized protein n=1 Tax=Utricularia reniformis TaxID=192314 RepID=A0A1Y0B1K3_9LAMI|nr:hypothetical protein AEK19_MT1035 [Utricularia reniformis]ART31258.1 hypothetical protein AEK19_MT1035 [Utricularia reniformis]
MVFRVGFPFPFTECDLGHDGSLRASVGKRSPEYSTRSPLIAAMGSTCEQGKPNGNQKTGVPHWAEDDPKSEVSPLKEGALEAYLKQGEIGKIPIPSREESRDLCRC